MLCNTGVLRYSVHNDHVHVINATYEIINGFKQIVWVINK